MFEKGRKQVLHSPPIDIPQPGKFDLGGLVGNVLAGLTVVAAVGVTLATFGAAGPVVLGAMAMGSMAVIGQGVSDVVSGQVSSQEAYMSVGFWSAVAGAVSGMVGSGVSKLLTSKLKMLTPMVVNGLSGMVETVAENAVLGVRTTLSDLGLAFAASTALSGKGKNLIRGIKGLDGKLDNALESTAKQTGTIPPKTPHRNSPPVQRESALKTSFVDNIADILKKEGLTVEEFNKLRIQDVSTLTDAEKVTLKAIRESVPMPDTDTLMQKVIPVSDIEKYMDGTYTQVGGYVTRAEDVAHLTSYDNLYYSLRLDYPRSAYRPMTDNSIEVIRDTTDEASKISIPYGTEMG